jgi:hypothetical protein
VFWEMWLQCKVKQMQRRSKGALLARWVPVVAAGGVYNSLRRINRILDFGYTQLGGRQFLHTVITSLAEILSKLRRGIAVRFVLSTASGNVFGGETPTEGLGLAVAEMSCASPISGSPGPPGPRRAWHAGKHTNPKSTAHQFWGRRQPTFKVMTT